ncbi:cytochrome P450 [Leptodontidium sp. MPI-SDFR-AT-0119]|nr:cytochrome P450 [Leptodontidium sp. MPI-SDFR-AT-0119]
MFSYFQLASAVLSYAVAHAIFVSIYRLTLHPYAKYPGPLLGKLSNIYAAYHAYTGDVHLDVERCHKKYGKFVRYRPNALLVNSVEGFHDIYGNGRKIKKAEGYKIHGPTNLIGIRDKAKYATFKKIFQQGFSDTMNREHEPKVSQVIDTFIEKLAENELPEESKGDWTNIKNMNLWCNWLTTDVVSKVIFTTSWDLLTSAANRGVTQCLKAAVRIVGILHAWPFLPGHQVTAFLCFPHVAWSLPKLDIYANSVINSSREARIKDPSIRDVFGIFTAARDPDTGEIALSKGTVHQNTATFIIAGSDTTASALSATFFYLARNPTAYAKVAEEIRAAFPSKSSICAGPTLNSCVYLRAAITESMRLSPVAPQPLMREAEAGCIVDGEHIPTGLKVASSIFTLQHNPAVFSDPYKWDMTRWLIDSSKDASEEKVRIKEISKSFAPFSVGPRQCIAKNFALMELYLTMANVFWKLDFESAGELGEGKDGEFVMKSYFTAFMEGPLLRFRKREGAEW